MTNITNISSKFSTNSEIFVSKLTGNINKMFHLYYIHTDELQYTIYDVTSREIDNTTYNGNVVVYFQ